MPTNEDRVRQVSNEDRLKQVLSAVLEVDPVAIDDSTSPDTVARWDSLSHLTLVLALEEQFDVSLTEEQTVEMLSYPLIKLVLGEHGVRFD
jgi:acyl carrier protein